jgi:acetyltransferase-like isoleucine patch superfamily enzyme
VCEGVRIGDGVFIGHNVTFINDLFPRATNPDGSLQTAQDWAIVPTHVEDGASLGSSVTVLAGVTIGARAIVGAGSVVTKNVGPGEIWAGNPARFLRKVDGE